MTIVNLVSFAVMVMVSGWLGYWVGSKPGFYPRGWWYGLTAIFAISVFFMFRMGGSTGGCDYDFGSMDCYVEPNSSYFVSWEDRVGEFGGSFIALAGGYVIGTSFGRKKLGKRGWTDQELIELEELRLKVKKAEMKANLMGIRKAQSDLVDFEDKWSRSTTHV